MTTKEATTTKKRAKAILTRTERARKFFSNRSFNKDVQERNFKINNDRERKDERKHEKSNYKTIRKHGITTFKRILQEFIMFI